MIKSSPAKPVRKLYKFLLLVPLFYLLFTPLWWKITPYYSDLLVALGNLSLSSVPFTSDSREFSYEQGSIKGTIFFTVKTKSQPWGREMKAQIAFGSRIFQFGFAIWVSLILATPYRDWKKKLMHFLIGWGIILFGELADMYLQVLLGKLEALKQLHNAGEYTLTKTEEYSLTWGYVSSLRLWSRLIPILLWFFMGLPRLRNAAFPKREQSVKPESPVPA